ncbi:MAG: hypothetical protein ACTHNY_01185 [Solirubrobacterales bacterium]
MFIIQLPVPIVVRRALRDCRRVTNKPCRKDEVQIARDGGLIGDSFFLCNVPQGAGIRLQGGRELEGMTAGVARFLATLFFAERGETFDRERRFGRADDDLLWDGGRMHPSTGDGDLPRRTRGRGVGHERDGNFEFDRFVGGDLGRAGANDFGVRFEKFALHGGVFREGTTTYVGSLSFDVAGSNQAFGKIVDDRYRAPGCVRRPVTEIRDGHHQATASPRREHFHRAFAHVDLAAIFIETDRWRTTPRHGDYQRADPDGAAGYGYFRRLVYGFEEGFEFFCRFYRRQ